MTDREPGSWAGQQLGRYRLGRLIGRGSMGEVYEAEDTVRQRTIALKLLWADLSRDAGFRERMQREARTAGRLQEPHVVPIHDYGEIDGHLFLDMRLIQGSDLARVLKQSGPLNAPRAVGLVTQAASALDAAHAVGVIHRDIKPANLLLTADDFLYLVDFGIASAAGDEPLETPKTIEGTWKYSAPELFTGNAGGRSIDIYALTAVLYECLTGTPPYRADGVQALIDAHVNNPIPRASQAPGVAPAFDAVIARGLAKNTQDRYATAGELAQALQQALKIPVPARPRPSPEVGRSVLPVAPHPQQRRAASSPAPMSWPAPGWVPPPPPAPARSGYQPPASGHPGAWRGTPPARQTPFYWDWRVHGPRLAAGAAALVSVIALIAWMTAGGGNEIEQSADPGVAEKSIGADSPGTAQLRKVIPTGYPDGTCKSVPVPAGAVAQIACGRSIDSGGPVAATYTLYSDRAAVAAAFQAIVGKAVVVTCPGRIQSPGPWHRASTPTGKVDGMLLCGFRQNTPRIAWSSDADLLVSDVQADERAVILDQLFAWWGTHS